MRGRPGVWILAALIAAGGCATSTAHRVALTGNPLREQAIACEATCRTRQPDQGDYARCLDTCPGASAIDDASCPQPPTPDVICVKTYKPNPGGIAGGTIAVITGATAVLAVAALASLPAWVVLFILLS
jgi:hypothetical protein